VPFHLTDLIFFGSFCKKILIFLYSYIPEKPEKYADNATYVMRENAQLFFASINKN
jgi:hypothetical protein